MLQSGWVLRRTAGEVMQGHSPSSPVASAEPRAARDALDDRAFHGVRAQYTVSQSAARPIEAYSFVLDRRPAGLSVA